MIFLITCLNVEFIVEINLVCISIIFNLNITLLTSILLKFKTMSYKVDVVVRKKGLRVERRRGETREVMGSNLLAITIRILKDKREITHTQT